MIGLYNLIGDTLETIVSSFADHYPDVEDKVYPYAEFKFPNITPTESKFGDLNLLEVDIWDDKATDIREIEQLTDSINNVLKTLEFSDTDMFVSLYKNTPYRLRLTDPLPHIQRRQLRYIAKVYYKNN